MPPSPDSPAALAPEQAAALLEQRAQRNETRRPTVPALEALLFTPIPCLDHGFVRAVDYMGDDGAVVQAARVSYGTGTKKVSEDRGLIRYLMRHRHTTPFEMCELKLHVKLPIFVARQWIRHRTACLAGDARLYFDLPAAEGRGRRQRHNVTMADFHRLWHEGTRHPIAKKKLLHVERIDPTAVYTIPALAKLVERREETLRNMVRAGSLTGTHEAGRIHVRGADWIAFADQRPEAAVPMRARMAHMQLRMCDETTGEIRHTTVTDVWSTGRKPVYRVTLENGYSLTMTKDHRCLTSDGWLTLQEATRLTEGVGTGHSWWPEGPALAVNGVPCHRDPGWLAQRRAEGMSLAQIASGAGVSTHTIRKALGRHGLQYSTAERSRLSGAAQRGQRRTFERAPMTEAARAKVRAARSGERSNFWKGGITPERANIGGWTTENAARVHALWGWRCAICQGKDGLNAHHVDPVWHNAARARDVSNLVTLCGECHRHVHTANLELELLEALQGKVEATFWDVYGEKRPRPAEKRASPIRRLVRTFSRVSRIDYIGEEETFDLSVAGPFHNFVANGFVVHNSVNENSGRYSILDKEFYLPRPEDLAVQSANNKQGRGDVLDADSAAEVLRLLRRDAEQSYDTYEALLDTHHLARELARMNLGVNYYTQWYWKIDLHNLLHFLSLRIDPHAQYEIRVYGEAIAGLVKAWTPHVWEAFEDYRVGALTLSRQMLDVVRRRLAGETVTFQQSGLSKREWDELAEALEA